MRQSKYTREVLAEAVASSVSIAGVLRHLGLTMSGGSHAHISRRIKFYDLDASHFTGQAHNKGVASRDKLPWQHYLIQRPEPLRKETVHRLRRAMIESGICYKCASCGGGGSWMGMDLRLEIDHIDGNPFDNRRENLRFLCPNCHAQTSTYCGHNQGNVRAVEAS